MCWSDLEHCFDLFFSFVCLQWRTLQTCRPHLLRPQQQSILGLWIKVGSRFLCVWREVRWETHWKNLNTFFPMSIPVAFWPWLEWGHSIWGHLLSPTPTSPTDFAHVTVPYRCPRSDDLWGQSKDWWSCVCKINFASFVDIIQIDLLFLIQHLQLLNLASSSSLLTLGAYLDQKLTQKGPNPLPVLRTDQTQPLLIPRPTMDLDSTLHESLESWTECCAVSPAAHVSRLLLKLCGIQVACSSSLQNQICWLLQTFLSSSVRPCL